MSMENAILEHASALRELSAAVRSLVDATMGSAITGAIRTVGGVTRIDGDLEVTGDVKVFTSDTAVEDKAAELAAATKQRAAAAREALANDGVKGTSREEAAKNQQELEAQRAAEVVKAVSDEIEEKGAVAADLDYAKDVRPVLLAAIKKAGKDAVAFMLGKYGVDKADKLKPEQLPAVLAEAQALAA